MNLAPDVVSIAGPNHDVHSFNGDVVSYANVWKGKQRYGSANALHGRNAQYAYVNGRVPVKIEYIFQAKQPLHGTLLANLAVVRCFQRAHNIPEFPWAIR